MKLPHILTLLILAAGAFLGVRERRQITTLREELRKAILEAESLDVSTDVTTPFTPSKDSNRRRDDNSVKIKSIAEELIVFMKEQIEASDKEPIAADQTRIFVVMGELLSLNGSDLKILVSEIQSRSDLEEEMKTEIIGMSMMIMTQVNPQSSLALITESSDLLKDNKIGSFAVASALGQWAKDQPLEAFEWIKNHGEKNKELVTDEAKNAVLTGAARINFELAFQFAREMNLSPGNHTFMYAISEAADTDEKRNEFLAAIRKQAEQINDKKAAFSLIKSGAGLMFSEMTRNGYDASVSWLNSAKLAPEETAIFVESLNFKSTKKDTGRWLDWMSSHAAKDEKTGKITRELVRQWTDKDYMAAGEWLANSPEGPLKNDAIISYIETVAPYDKDAALEWADTLPADQRTESLLKIQSALNKEKN